jgi:hypothetical protein
MVEGGFEVGDDELRPERADVLEVAFGVVHHEVKVEGHAVDIVDLAEADGFDIGEDAVADVDVQACGKGFDVVDAAGVIVRGGGVDGGRD